MFNLADIFERVIDSFDKRTFSQQDFFLPLHQPAFHICTHIGYQFNSLGQQFFKQALAGVRLK